MIGVAFSKILCLIEPVSEEEFVSYLDTYPSIILFFLYILFSISFYRSCIRVVFMPNCSPMTSVPSTFMYSSCIHVKLLAADPGAAGGARVAAIVVHRGALHGGAEAE